MLSLRFSQSVHIHDAYDMPPWRPDTEMDGDCRLPLPRRRDARRPPDTKLPPVRAVPPHLLPRSLKV